MTDKEKLDRMKKLSDAMYTAAQYLSTDASGLRKAMDEYHKFIIYEYNKQEPASEVFESEWKRYCDSKGGGAVTMNVKDTAKHFTEWQETQDQQTIELAEEHAMLAGMMQEREQMMKDAIEATIDIIYTPTTWLPDIVYDTDKLKDLCKDKFEQGDRVKVIIIKE